ncbi:MAG: hypothetical protein M3Y07_12885 [Acidobacteriota bacterium]|nr:hypothetical protein [Acidobacteriota bacterium]
MQGRPYVRFLLLLLAIGSTLVVSTVAATPSHWHSGDIGGGCQICVAAHLPVVQPPSVIGLPSPVRNAWQVPAALACPIVECCKSAVSSRGPPV